MPSQILLTEPRQNSVDPPQVEPHIMISPGLTALVVDRYVGHLYTKDTGLQGGGKIRNH